MALCLSREEKRGRGWEVFCTAACLRARQGAQARHWLRGRRCELWRAAAEQGTGSNRETLENLRSLALSWLLPLLAGLLKHAVRCPVSTVHPSAPQGCILLTPAKRRMSHEPSFPLLLLSPPQSWGTDGVGGSSGEPGTG